VTALDSLTGEALEREAFELVRNRGHSQGEAARLLKVSRGSIKNYVAREQARRDASASKAPEGFLDMVRARAASEERPPRMQSAPPPAPTLPPAPPLPEGDEPLDAVGYVRAQIEYTRRLGEQARAEGNMTLAQRCGRDVGNLMPVLARLERMAKDDETTLHVSRAEVNAAIQSVRDQYTAICDRPLLCEECGQRMLRKASED